MARSIVRSGLWRRRDEEGLERFELSRDGEAWVLSGTILAAGVWGTAEARYEVVCAADWRTRRVEVFLRHPSGERALMLAAAAGRWWADGVEQPGLQGCVDVDLEWSPSTNTLPIRRLAPPVGGGSGPLRMAWVRFPSLAIEPLPQEYRRTADGRYHYSSGGGSFQADIDVDDEGLVVRYEGGWERVGSSSGPEPTRGRSR